MKLSYEPKELSFGTSGLRGLLSDMTDLECYINTAGFIDYLVSKEGLLPQKIYLAGDLRDSTPRIMRAVAKAIEDRGSSYENCGFVPTPAVAYEAQLHSSPCIMVTGSHIPDDRNGIKFYTTSGEVLKSDEKGIKQAVKQKRAELYNSEESVFDSSGMFVESNELTAVSSDAENDFHKRYTSFFEATLFTGKKIVYYQQSSVGRDSVPAIFAALGAEVVTVDRSDTFIPIDTENVTAKDTAYFKSLAEEHPDCFAILSTDGDSDRPFVVDANGVFHRGDELGIVVSEYLGIQQAAIPISSNDSAKDYLEKHGVSVELTKIGSPYVIVAMQEMSGLVGGWEVNGGYLLGSDLILNGKELKPLPTRDAVLPMICALAAATQKSISVSELFEALPNRFTGAGLINNFPNETSKRITDMLAKDDDQARSTIESVFKGFGNVTSINSIDGIRISFSSGDVAHIRPSGNAPQLRIYSNANSQERADQIVALGVAEPDGILRSIQKVVN